MRLMDCAMSISWNEIRKNPIHRTEPEDQDSISLEGAALMDDLHDALESGGCRGHELELRLVGS